MEKEQEQNPQNNTDSDTKENVNGENFDEKLEQNEDLAKLRAGVSLAKTGVNQAKIMIDD